MTELESKMKQSNPIFVAQSISKLIERIKNKQNSETALKYLKNKCITSEDVVLCLAASKALVMLVECEILPMPTLLAELISALSITKSYIGIISTVCDLLQLDLKYKTVTNKNYKCAFNLRAPQHPLISILIQEPATGTDILSRIKYFYEGDSEQSSYANELLYPFYMYVICIPTLELPEICQYKLWNFIIGIGENQSIDIRLYLLMWLQMPTKQHSVKSSNFLISMVQHKSIEMDDDIKEVLILWLTSLVPTMIKHQNDPRSIIDCLCHIFKDHRQLLNNTASSILIMLADCIPMCPSVYLSDLLQLCKFIIKLNLSNNFANLSVKAALLQWLAYGCILTNDSLQIAKDILLHIENNKATCNAKKLHSNKTFQLLKNTNQHVYTAVQLSILSESLTTKNILHWLNQADKLPVTLLKITFNYFAALLLHEFTDSHITLKVIEILLKIGDVYKETTTQMLTLILYKLSNTSNPDIHFILLKALPKMAVMKENLPLVLNTLELIRKGMLNMKSFAITLYFDLWDIDVKCYPHLQNVLVATCDKNEGTTQWWEFYVTKANVLKQICLKRPELHGRELVGHLSEILNKCSDENGGLPSAFAIEGIKALCKAGIIDITSTWKELVPRFSAEKRIVVIKSLCDLMAEVASFEPSEFSDKLVEEVIAKLWNYATMHNDSTVVFAAYHALSCFSLEQISSKLCDVIEDKPAESTLPFNLVKGDCWISLLLQSQHNVLEAVGNLLIQYVSTEISGYHSGTYKVEEGRREPQDFNYLPVHSIVRALGNYLRQHVQKWQDTTIKPVYLQCLRILSQKYSKPLPPTDWCFLQELIHSPEARVYCITLASHQVQLSGTARRLIENYISALTEIDDNDLDIQTIYENLKYLCNSIQPMTLRPFIDMSMAHALQKAKEYNEETLFEILVTHLKRILSDEDVQESNRMVLSQIIAHTAQQMDTDSPLFTTLLNCIVALPIRYIDELSSPRLWKDASPSTIKLSVRVRCALALQANVSPLIWMNDFIDAASFVPTQHYYVLKNIIQVMESYRNSDFASAWILELLGHIQSTIANENTTDYQLKFLCDVFILSMVVLSGQDIFINSPDDLITRPECRLELFPQAVAQLVRIQRWKSYVPQILEWLFHMTNSETTPENYKFSFYQSLAALRHEEAFDKFSRWMKYLGNIVPLNT